MMDSFRWVLIAIGVAILAGIVLIFWLEKRFPHWFGHVEEKPEPSITEDEVIYLNVRARQGMIEGPDLIRAMEKFRLVHGEMGIFHRLTEGSEQPLFSVANMVEPGSFDADKLATMRTPGLTLFLRLPRTFDALHALDEMWDAAKGLAQELDADMLDRHHQLFTSQKQQKMRDEVLEYMRQIALQEKISQYME